MSIPTHYTTRYVWTGVAEKGELSAGDHAPLAVGSPLDPTVFNPEHLLLSAAEVCLANTFLVIAEKSALVVVAYASSAEGELEFVPREGFRFSGIRIEARVSVAVGDEDKAGRILEKAHKACLVSRSLNCPVEVVSFVNVADA